MKLSIEELEMISDGLTRNNSSYIKKIDDEYYSKLSDKCDDLQEKIDDEINRRMNEEKEYD